MGNIEEKKEGILVTLDMLNKLGILLRKEAESEKASEKLIEEFIGLMKKGLEKYG